MPTRVKIKPCSRRLLTLRRSTTRLKLKSSKPELIKSKANQSKAEEELTQESNKQTMLMDPVRPILTVALPLVAPNLPMVLLQMEAPALAKIAQILPLRQRSLEQLLVTSNNY